MDVGKAGASGFIAPTALGQWVQAGAEKALFKRRRRKGGKRREKRRKKKIEILFLMGARSMPTPTHFSAVGRAYCGCSR